MDVNEAIVARHSVRRYTTRPIGDDAVGRLRAAIDEANEASGLSIQLVRNEPDAFSNPLKTLGQFRNVSTYLAFVAPEGDDQDERLALPLYVSRQVDDETHRAQEARKRLLAAAVLQQQTTDALNND